MDKSDFLYFCFEIHLVNNEFKDCDYKVDEI